MPDQQSLFDDDPALPRRTPRLDNNDDFADAVKEMDRTLARRTAAAAEDPDHITPNQAAVLRVFEEGEGLTDAALVSVYEARYGIDPEWPVQSPSGLRTRRRELTDKGRLRDSGARVRLESGRTAVVWSADQ